MASCPDNTLLKNSVIFVPEVLIAGAGAAGQAAAFSLRRHGVDHADRGAQQAGWSHKTQTDGMFPIEHGAEFVHGSQVITHRLAAHFGKRDDSVPPEQQYRRSFC